jgi:quercetin dioxygenase-like cupin family protein
MPLLRRQLLYLAGAAAAPAAAWAQAAPAGPKVAQVLRQDLTGQSGRVEETMVTTVEFPPGAMAPWHMHPGAQELFYALEGALTVETETSGAKTFKSGEAGIIPADEPHTVRNESTSATGRLLVVHSRSEKAKPLRVDVKKG